MDNIRENVSDETPEMIAFIRCNGDAAGKKRLAKCSSCEEAKNLGFLDNECQWGCIGIGSCISSCKENAMSLVDGRIVIDKEKCSGCGDCASQCPQKLISIIPREATNLIPCSSKDAESKTRKVCGYGCIGCGACVEVCPQDAVKVVDNCAVIDYEKCVGCVACTVKCEKKIIIDELHDLTKIKETVAFVRCQGGKKAKARFEALGMESCTEASKVRSTGMGLCTTGCVGLGECTKACRYDAIHVVNGTAKVDPEKCVGCLDCVHTCPNNLILEVPYKGAKVVACSSRAPGDIKATFCDVGCIGCGDCAANCPNGAVAVYDNRAIVDISICENCGVCSYMCSRYVLTEQFVPEYTYAQYDVIGK